MKEKIKKLLAEHIGVDTDDLKDDDSFVTDLHMNAVDLGDFVHFLENQGFDTRNVDLTNIETVDDLVEALDLHE